MNESLFSAHSLHQRVSCLPQVNHQNLRPLSFPRVTVRATPTASLCYQNDRGREGMWRCLPPSRPSTSSMMMEFNWPWSSTLSPSASSKREPDGSTPLIPTRRSTRSSPAPDISVPLWGSGAGDGIHLGNLPYWHTRHVWNSCVSCHGIIHKAM